MKFSCDKGLIQEALNTVQRASLSSSDVVTLMGTLINAKDGRITFSCNNGEISIDSSIEADIEEDGSVVLFPSSALVEYIRKKSGEIIFIESSQSFVTKIKSGASISELIGVSSSEFQPPPVINSERKVIISCRELKSLINGVSFSAGKNENKMILMGCLVEVGEADIQMVAADGFRMASKKVNTEHKNIEASFVVPSKSLGELNKIIPDSDDAIQITLSKNNAVFSFGNVNFYCRVLEGEYIDYKKVIPHSFSTEIKVSTADFEDAIDRTAAPMSEINKAPLEIKISQEMLEISSETQRFKGYENMNVEMKGEELRIGFNHKYLLDALRACEDEFVKISFNSSSGPCLIESVDGSDKYKYIVFPLRLR